MSAIFDSYANVTTVTAELEHLPQSARDLFGSRTGMFLSSFSWNKHEDWGGLGKWACRWASMGANISQEAPRGLKTIGRVVLCVDMFRDRLPLVEREKLAHAEVSLLSCCFMTGKEVSEETYEVDYLKFTADGWPIHSDLFIRHANGRLLEYVEGKENSRPWTERSWLFTVPLEAILSPRDFTTEIAEPLWMILSNNPEAAFGSNSRTCIFPQPARSNP